MKHTFKLKTRNIALYKALKVFTKDTLKVLSNAIDSGATIPTFQETKWQASEQENHFQNVSFNKPEYWILFHKSKTAIEDLPSYKQAKSLLESDEIWFSHMNKLNGSCMSSSRLELDQILNSIPHFSLSETHQLKPSHKHINERIEFLESYFLSTEIEYVRTTPVYGVTLKSNFSISDNTSFEILSDDAICSLLEKGIITSERFRSFYESIFDPPRAAIVSRFSFPKIVKADGDSQADPFALADLFNRLGEEETKAIDLLSMIIDIPIIPTGHITETFSIMKGSYQYHLNAVPKGWRLPSRMLEEVEKDKYCEFLSVINEAKRKSRHFLTIAVRRYSLALSRPSLDDKLIDLMICAEALFLGDGKGELTNKLAYRMALLLGENSLNQRDIFKFMIDVYSMRSTVVHGTKSYTQDPKEAEKLSSMIPRLSELLRQALLKFLTLALNRQAPKELIDWEVLMFKEAN